MENHLLQLILLRAFATRRLVYTARGHLHPCPLRSHLRVQPLPRGTLSEAAKERVSYVISDFKRSVSWVINNMASTSFNTLWCSLAVGSFLMLFPASSLGVHTMDRRSSSVYPPSCGCGTSVFVDDPSVLELSLWFAGNHVAGLLPTSRPLAVST